jgi:hypothetical protein
MGMVLGRNSSTGIWCVVSLFRNWNGKRIIGLHVLNASAPSQTRLMKMLSQTPTFRLSFWERWRRTPKPLAHPAMCNEVRHFILKDCCWDFGSYNVIYMIPWFSLLNISQDFLISVLHLHALFSRIGHRMSRIECCPWVYAILITQGRLILFGTGHQAGNEQIRAWEWFSGRQPKDLDRDC